MVPLPSGAFKAPMRSFSGRANNVATPTTVASDPCPTGGGSLFFLLLDSDTKEEEEDFLSYSFPQADTELQAMLPMKGVLLAGCGLMRTGVGQDVSLLSFRSLHGGSRYKAALRRVEQWVLCIVLPGSASDCHARFFAEEAAELTALRHGRLSAARSDFKQLDPILRSLSVLWQHMAEGHDGVPVGGLMYSSLGISLWNSLSDRWQDDLQKRITDWETRWRAGGGCSAFAQPEAFAVFLGHSLLGTSLSDCAFQACLRLCHLEGMWDAAEHIAAPPPSGSGLGGVDACDVRCRSLFLDRACLEADSLPSHQYCIIQQGPWALFMLWRMGVRSELNPADMKSMPPTHVAGDPFGVDLCIDFLSALPLPGGQAPPPVPMSSSAASRTQSPSPNTSARHPSPSVAALRAASPNIASIRAASPASPSPASPTWARGSGGPHGRPHHRKNKLAKMGLPSCLTWKRPPRPRPEFSGGRPARFLHAVELKDCGPPVLECTECSELRALRGPPARVARDRIAASEALLCPEARGRAECRGCSELASSWGLTDLLAEWRDLDALASSHAARRAAWARGAGGGGGAGEGHPLLSALFGTGGLEELWAECLGEGSAQQSRQAPPGDAWRFQHQAPYDLGRDLPGLLGLGQLTGQPDGGCSWQALAARRDGGRTLMRFDPGREEEHACPIEAAAG